MTSSVQSSAQLLNGSTPERPAIGDTNDPGHSGGEVTSGPLFAPPVFDRIPLELQKLHRWVTWKFESRHGKKPRKVPYNPTLPSSRASSTDTETWGTFDQACAAWAEGGYMGIGFVLNGDGIAGVDLDDCVDANGTPSALAMKVLETLQAGYIELSPSGTGLRAIGYAENLSSGVDGELSDLSVELYTSKRYLTMTGHAIKAGSVNPFWGFGELANQLRISRTKRSAPAANGVTRNRSTNAILARGARPLQTIPQGAEFERLIADLRSALEFLSSDSYGAWVCFGMALKTLGPPGRDLWMNWSRESSKFDEEDASRTWTSFKPEHTGYAAIFAAAQAAGWVNPGRGARLRDGADVGSQLDINARIAARAGVAASERADGAPEVVNGSGRRPQVEAERENSGTAFAEHLLKPPGIVGQIAQWILETSPKPQPAMATTAALVMAGAALANKVRFGSSYTHLYCVNVANSGEGKDRPQACISEAFEAAGAKMAAKLPGSQIASGQALMTIGHREPTTVLVLDEFGDMLAKATSKTAASFEREVTTILKIQWSHAGRVMRGREYADQRQRPRQDIQFPCMSMLGSSTPGRFYSSITPNEIEDGTLNRLLTVRSANYPDVPIHREPVPVPDVITNWLTAANDIEPIPMTKQTIEQLHQPRSVKCSPMAQQILDAFSREAEDNRHALLTNSSRAQLAGWWVRASENARRIALILAVGRYTESEALHVAVHDDALNIDPASAQWAVEYVRTIVEDMLEQSEGRIGDSDLERVVIAVEAVLRKAGQIGMTRREMRRKCSAFRNIFDPAMADRVWQSVVMRGALQVTVPPASGKGPSRDVLMHQDSTTAAEAA